jgi:hypothetical protein
MFAKSVKGGKPFSRVFNSNIYKFFFNYSSMVLKKFNERYKYKYTHGESRSWKKIVSISNSFLADTQIVN